jgi:hypothetical protein
LSGTEEAARELLAQELLPAARCAMHDQHRIRYFAIFIFCRVADRHIMKAQFPERFPAFKRELPDRIVAFFGRRIFCLGKNSRAQP